VDDLQEELTRARVEDEDGAVDGLGGEVAFEGLVDGDAIDIGVVDEQLNLVAEQLVVVLAVQELLATLTGVELETFPDPLT
jgi:hypothetical protein